MNRSTQYFERVFCISLESEPSRWKNFRKLFPRDWPFPEVQRFAAIDGNQCAPELWWTVSKPAWGCYRSHLEIVKHCLNEGVASCLILEDDAIFGPTFSRDVIQFLDALPNDWQWVYLGGQHLDATLHPPVRVSPDVYIPWNVNRTHAYAIRSRQGMERFRNHLLDSLSWQVGHHVDHHLGERVKRRDFPVYCPRQWLVGQNEGRSSICRSHVPTRFFHSNEWHREFAAPFVAILDDGSQSKARKVIAALENAGMFHGSEFVTQPNGVKCSKDLWRIAEELQPCLNEKHSGWEGSLRCALHAWIRYATCIARELSTVAFASLPQFIAWAPILESLVGPRLKIINLCSHPEICVAKDFLRTTSAPVFNAVDELWSLSHEHRECEIVDFCFEDQ